MSVFSPCWRLRASQSIQGFDFPPDTVGCLSPTTGSATYSVSAAAFIGALPRRLFAPTDPPRGRRSVSCRSAGGSGD